MAAAALVNAGPIAANLLAKPDQDVIVSEFSYAVLVARVPLFMFQAVQAALLPKLARLAAQGLLRRLQGRASAGSCMVVVRRRRRAASSLAATIGPAVLDIVFNAEIGRRTLTLLALGSAMYMVGARASPKPSSHSTATPGSPSGWIAGLASFIVVTAVVSHDLLLRVELGLVAGSAVAMATFACALHLKLRRRRRGRRASFIDAITDHPLETP